MSLESVLWWQLNNFLGQKIVGKCLLYKGQLHEFTLDSDEQQLGKRPNPA